MVQDLERPRPSRLDWCITYLLWCFGGIFGWHHVYLGRLDRAFVYCFTWAGWGWSWIFDFFQLPHYLDEAWGTREYLENLQLKQKYYRQPQVPWSNWVFQLFIGMTSGFIWSCVLPETIEGGSGPLLDEMTLYCGQEMLSIFGTAWGIYLIGGTALDRYSTCSFRLILSACFLSYVLALVKTEFWPVQQNVEESESEEGGQMMWTTTVAGMAAFAYSREWNFEAEDGLQVHDCIDVKKTRGEMEKMLALKAAALVGRRRGYRGRWCRLVCVHVLCLTLGMSVLSLGLINYGQFTTLDGVSGEPRVFTVAEGLRFVWTSPIVTEFKDTLEELGRTFRTHGFQHMLDELKLALDPDGTIYARRVLGLESNENPSQHEIRRAYKRLAIQFHPDKVRHLDGFTPEEAAAEFVKIQHAYELLSNRRQYKSEL